MSNNTKNLTEIIAIYKANSQNPAAGTHDGLNSRERIMLNRYFQFGESMEAPEGFEFNTSNIN